MLNRTDKIGINLNSNALISIISPHYQASKEIILAFLYDHLCFVYQGNISLGYIE